MRNALAVFAISAAVYWLTVLPPTPFNEQTRQSVAFLHGRVSINSPEIDGDHSFFEHAAFKGYSYALHPPLAAVAMMPLAAIRGVQADERIVSVLCGAMSVALVWVLLGRLGLLVDERIWLTAFFGLGTIFWTETISGTTWTMPVVVTMCVELLTLIELSGNSRPLRVGIYAGLSALGLYQLAFVAPIYAWMLFRKSRKWLWMALGLLGAALIYIAYNEARYGVLTDQGLWLIPHVDTRPIFGLKYLAGNLNTLLVMGPVVDNNFPYVHPTIWGQALTFTSPAFLLALRPAWRRVWPMWLAALLAAGPMLLCYANGFAQFGARHYVDCYPFLLVALAKGRVDQLAKVLICVSICLVAYGVLYLHLGG